MNFNAIIVILIAGQIQSILSFDSRTDLDSKKEMEHLSKLRQLINIEKILYELKKPESDDNLIEPDSYDDINSDELNLGNSEDKRSAYLRFGRSPAFLRFGRNQAYLRFGKRFGNYGAKRNPTYLRFGRMIQN